MTKQWLPLPDAATELGISVEAARMRVKRGTLQGEKRSGKVYIYLNTDPTPTERDRTTDPTATEQQQPSDQPPPPDQTALVEQLQSEVTFLRAELESRREADREQRIIISQLAGRVEALQAGQLRTGSTEPNDQHEVEETTGRPWWKFWEG
jgi:hypothetical protein